MLDVIVPDVLSGIQYLASSIYMSLGDRSMAGRLTLDQLIGVRIPVPQVVDYGELLVKKVSSFRNSLK